MGQEKDGHYVALGKPIANDATARGQGFALPTSASWPGGAYRLDVTVADAAGAKVTGVAPFTLAIEQTP
jgi:hypothetical protein